MSRFIRERGRPLITAFRLEPDTSAGVIQPARGRVDGAARDGDAIPAALAQPSLIADLELLECFC